MSEFELYQCFNKHERDFLVSVTVHKARNLNTLNADTFVAISFNNETKRTKTYRNSDSPFFNEVSFLIDVPLIFLKYYSFMSFFSILCSK
jgi:hypothetical protein